MKNALDFLFFFMSMMLLISNKTSLFKLCSFRLLLVCCFIISGLSVFSTSAFAEGSRELNPTGSYRAFLRSSTSSALNPFPIQGLVRVYVKEGETIYVGSSAQGVKGGTIHLRAPNGTYYTSGTSITNGVINFRSEEMAGPLPSVGGYTPKTIDVGIGSGQAGVWEVYFIGPDDGTANPTSRLSEQDNFNNNNGSGSNRVQPNTNGYIAAFDVTVRKTSDLTYSDIPGRAYMNVFAACSGDGNATFGGMFHVLTKDGYKYSVNANGFQGQTFVFFANNKGYKTGSTDNAPASYLSVNNTLVTNLKNPLTEDSTNPDLTDADITHKLFFNDPSADLPLSASIRTSNGLYNFGVAGIGTGTLSTTWLLKEPDSPEITEFKFTGIEGTDNQGGVSPMGGNLTFKVNQSGTYQLNIDIDQNGTFGDAIDRRFTGTANVGLNTIYWNGRDGLGTKVADNVVFNASSVQISLVSGEVHFPLIDVEANNNGLIITRTNGLNTNDIVYWDDSGTSSIVTAGSSKTELGGSSSATAGHKWSGGDNMGLDTWTYVSTAVQPLPFNIQLKEADLEVLSLASDKATYCIGETITYTLTVINNGPNAVTGAKLALSFPAEITSLVMGTSVVTGTVMVSDYTTAGATLDMSSDATFTAIIKGIVNAMPTGGTLAVKASILRPADVYDPDATNPDNVPPTDPDAECAVGCNNIKTHSAAVQVSDISIAASSASKSEGNTVNTFTDMTFIVSLSVANTGCPVTVNYALQHATSNDSDFDFTLPFPKSGTLTFAPGETSKVITFKVKQDLMVEAAETFSVILSNPSSGGKITTAFAIGSIGNDDTISQIGITKVDGAEPGTNASFTFTFPDGASFDVDTPIPYTLTGTATGSGTDYTAAGTAGTITLPAGSNSVTLDLTVINDVLTEGNETVIITPDIIGNIYNPSVTVITPIPVVTIADNDPATLTISNGSITEGDDGTQGLTFNVTLSNPTGSAFDVNYVTVDGTALAGEDYVAKSGTIRFDGIAETRTITIQINGDQKIEQNETFTILTTLTNNFDGKLTVVGSTATGTIIDNDNTTENRVITITPTNGQELGPKPGVFTFSFPEGVSTDQPTKIDFGLTGTAGIADYDGSATTSVTIPAGSNFITLSLPVRGDDILEGPESVILTTTTVTNSYNITVGNSPQTLYIIDDDAANILTDVVTVTEGDNGLTNMIFNVQLDKATGSGFTIGYTISNGTAVVGEDYITPSGLYTGLLTFSGLPETKEIIVQVIGDQKIEADETLILTLGTPSNTFDNDLAVQNSPAVGTIIDDDNDPLNKIITITKANGYEGIVDSEASFTFSLPNGVTVDTDTEISYSLTGTATGGAVDYIGAASGTIRILAGQNSATLVLPVVDDLVLEGDETVIVTVNGTSNPTYDPFTVSNSGLSLSIIENDNTILLSSSPLIIEGNSGKTFARFTVSIDLATGGPFSIKYATSNGTAIAGEDYESKTGTLFFAGTAGEKQFIDIEINGDLKIEADETFIVTLTDLSDDFGGNLLVSDPVTMIIEDDDNIPANKIISISKTDGAEPGTNGSFTLSLPTGITVDEATTVNYILSGTAQAGGVDYTDTELLPIIIPAGEHSVTINMINVVDDSIIEGTESVLMTITSVTNPSYTGFAGNTPVALDILDDDNTDVNNIITLSKVADGKEPGTKAQFMVSFPSTITAAVPTTVNYTISGTALAGLDYTALTGTVIIPTGSNSALIDVLVIDDQIIEELETVELTLTSASNSISTLTVGSGMVSANIADDDNIPSNNIVTLRKVLDGSEPGTDAQFEVSFPTGMSSSVDTKVFYTVDPNSTATPGMDYTSLSGTVTILAGNNSAFIDVKVIDDKIIENTETVLLTLTSATNTVSILTVQPVNRVGVTITDNDNTINNNIISIIGVTNASEPAANGLFTVSYPAGISSSEATLVTYTISGTADNGIDYTTIPLTVTIPAYANSVNINIDVINDKIIEPTETVGLTLTLADNTSFDPKVNSTLADIDIVDDDNNPANNSIILKAGTNGSEPGTPGQFTIGFPIGFTSSEQTIVNYIIDGTATPGTDYTALTGTVIIPANSGPVPINIAVIDDNIIEGTETVEITLNNATNSIINSLATLPNTAVSINIDDDEDDDPADNIITLTKTDGSEPGSNPTFVVSYPPDITSSKNTQIVYTIGAGGTATSGTDYTTLSGTATILAGSNSTTIQVPVIDDKIIEPTETIELIISGANNSISTLTWSPLGALTANIEDDDNTLAANTITLSRVVDGEEPGTPARFKLSFPPGYTSSALTTVTYTVGGTAVPGTDYTALSGTATIPANTNSVFIDVEVLDDQVIEPIETVSLTLTSATNANAPMAIIPNGSTVIVNIKDNDNNGSNNHINFSLIRNGTEGGDNPLFEVSFPAGYSSSEPTVITFAPTGINTAILGVDYSMPFSTVTIPPYTNSAIIEIPLINDLILEPTESFHLVLTGATNGVAAGLTYQTSPVQADISDDDNIAANNVITLTKVSDGIEAGTPAVFNVSFPAGYTNSVATTVNYVVSGGTASVGTDYTVIGQVIIPAGSGSANFDVILIDDQILEETETVQLTLVDATNSIFDPITVNLAPATANILDDDSAVVTNKVITITPDDGAEVSAPGVQNPANFSFRFPFGITSSAPTVISYVLTGTAGGNGTDHTGPVSGTITIPANQNSVTLTLPVIDDDIVENNETVMLTTDLVSNIHVAGINIDNSPVTLNITDNDAAILTVNNSTVTEGNSGDTEIEFTVTLDKATGGSFSLAYATGDLSAKATDNDYNAQSASLSFAGNAGESISFKIHVNGDLKIEEDEIFNVIFSTPTNTFGGRLTMPVPMAIGTIENDDSGAITISSSPGSETNPNPNGASFTFSFPPGVSSDLPTTIYFGLSVGSTATIGDDYIFPDLTGSGSVTIPPGVNSQTVILPVVDDAVVEPTETIILTVGSVLNSTVTTPTATTTIIDNDAASVSLSTPLTVNENEGTATFTVTLTGNVQEAFSVNFVTSNGTAIAPFDYTHTTGTVSFPAGSVNGATQIFTVAIQDDDLVEPGETLSATLSGITGLTTIGTATALTTIIDDDAASVAISAPVAIDENAGTATFTVTLTGNVQEAFTVNYATTNGTAIAPGDYTPGTGTITFPAGSVNGATETFTVAILDDDILESSETFSASLTSITGLTTIGTASVTTTITDNDAAGLSISTPGSVSEATGIATFTVTLTGNVQEAFTVDYATLNGTAIAPDDYATTTGTLTFPAGSLSGSTLIIQVPLVNDGVTEPGETFSVTLSNITGLTRIVTGTATTIMTDMDAAGVSLSAPAIINEADGTATFTVTLSGDVQDEFTVGFATTNGTAIAPGDYLSKFNSVTFPAGSVSGATQTFTIDIVNDNFAEPDEMFSVTLNSISSPLVTIGTSTATTIINDDDVAGVSLSTDPTVNESSGEATFTVTLTGGVQDAFTVDYTTSNGTAIAPGDYTATATGTVTFPAGSLSGTKKNFKVPIQDDNIREPTETFKATLNNITSLATIATSTATSTIIDNDVASVAITTNPTVNEGGTATFTVTLTGNVQEDFTVNYETVNGTAIQPKDYTYTPGSITFPAGSVTGDKRTFTVPIFNDQLAEGDETFSATLTSITGGLVTIGTATATTTIVDNDAVNVSISTSETVNEEGGTATFRVTLNGGIQDAFSVDYATANGSAFQPNDYTDTKGTLNFPAGSVNGTTLSFTVPILNDNLTEPNETFNASLSNITSGLATIGIGTATTTIIDNDVASVSLSTPLTVNEDIGTATFTVTLTGNVQEAFSVDYATANGTAIAPGDYITPVAGTVSFPAGSVSGATQLFTVAIQDDNLVEPDEAFSTTLTGITGLTTISGATATTTILDNDAASVSLSTDPTVNEAAGTASFTVTLMGNVQEAFSVNYVTTNGTAIAPGDYANTIGTVNFPVGSLSGATETFTIPILDDNIVESSETFSATLSSITGLTTIGTATATITITDNDAASISLSAPDMVSEATGIVTFTVTLSGNIQEAFTVDYATSNGTAQTPDDYASTTGTITFPAGSLSGTLKTFNILIQNDNLVETDETFSATLTNITGLTTISAATATTTITDNDVASVSISAPIMVNENAGTATFTVTLAGSVQEAITVNYATANGSASAPADYLARTGTVTFPAGSANGAVQTFTVDLVNDTFAESNETFSASLTGVTGLATISSAKALATTTIIDDDEAGVSLSTDPTVNEDAGTATFTVTLTGGIQDNFTVDYTTANGTAIAPGDYTATTGTVTFPAGSVSGTTQTFTVPIQDDNLRERSETFRVDLSNSIGLANIVTATATTTIIDNDVASVAITTDPTVNEAAGTATFTVTLTGNVQQAFTVNYETVNGTASQPNDYIYTQGSITFPAGSVTGASHTFTVPIFNDQLAEGDETFSAILSSITGGLASIGTGTATTTIIDDDAASVSISAPRTVNEAAGTVTFIATLSGAVQEAFSVDYATTNGSAQSPNDYIHVTGTFNFPAGSVNGTVRSFVVPILNDNLTETDETFSVNLSNISSGLVTIGTGTATTTIIDNDLAELSIADVTMVEGDGGTTDMSFSVKLNNATAKPFNIGYTTADGTATVVDNDYEPVLTGATLSFNGLANEIQTITIKINGDKKIEADETFKVVLGTLSETFDGRLTINNSQNSAIGTIANDESGEITITKVDGDEQGSTAGSFIFSLPSGVTSDQSVVINYTLGGSATTTTPDPDYIGALTGTVTIAAGDERTILNLPVNDDEIVEDDETVTINASLSSINSGVTLNASRPIVTIKDNDVAKLILNGPVTLSETNAGATTATFTVTLDKKTTGSFNLKYATADGTAKSGDNDYISKSGVLHFAGNAGESYPIMIKINGDKKIEQDEVFNLVLSNLSQTFNNRLTIPVTSTTVTIENDDSGTIIIVPADGSEDGTPGISPANFTFRFNDPDMSTDVPVTINYGLSGTALSTGTDYDYTASPTIGSITLPANAKSVKLNLNVNDDEIVEGTETVILTTSTGALPYGITVSNSPQNLKIYDNDGAKLTISNATVIEGNSGLQDITFYVKLDKAIGEPFTITYATANGTAIEGEDYIGKTGVLNFNGTVGEIQMITVQVKGDQKIEKDETFIVTLGAVSSLNDILSIPSPEAKGIITDDDHTQIVLSKVTDGEEPLNNARFKVNFVNPNVTSSEATQVSYSIDGTAINGVDYIALNGKVIIPAGSNEAFIEVEVIDDQLIEPTETVILNLTDASSSSFTIPVDATPVSANIKDNDQVVLTVSNPVVTEGNNGTVTAIFNVILSTDTPNGFTVSYQTMDGTATVADNDYTAVNGTLNFNGTAGETHAISVTVKGDQKIERDEKFNMLLNLSDTFGGRLNLLGSPAVGTILDDDDIPANKKITIATADGMEGLYNGSFTFSFPMGITSDSPTTIPFILGGTAFKNLDYIAMFTSPIVIPAGVNSLTLPVPVIDDDIMEGTETLQMVTGGIGNNRYNGITVNTPVPVLNIFDNDYSQLTISSPTIYEGNSGGTLLTFEVKLNGATGAGFTVDYATEDGTATLNDYDYNFVNGTLVFNGTVEGETKTISVWINGDINIEDNENFHVVLSGLSSTFGGALKISEWPGFGTILNDDHQPVALDDIVMTDEDTPVTFSVTGNDTDVDGTVNPESIKVVNSTVHGTLLFNPDGTFTYTPDANYNGKDEFTYTVNDNTGIESNVAKVSIVINAVNDAPVARDDIFYVLKDSSLNATVKSNDTDFDGDHLNFSVLSSPSNGKLTSFNPADGSFVYVPDNGFVGIDHFSYRACDAPGLCSTAQVTLYVQPMVTVKLTPSVATITEGDLIDITAEIGEPLFQDVEIILNYTGSAVQEKDYILEGDHISMVIPAGDLTTTQKFTIRSIKDFLKEGNEDVQVRVQTVNPSDFVNKGLGSDILIKDFYPEDRGTDENANGDINPDPLASPNGDGLGNENFIIHNIERYPDNEVLIFNRWGNKVFQVKGYNNRDKAFAGIANTGLLVNKNSVLVDGVYFYIIYTKDSTGALRVNKGSVIIKR